MHEDSNISLEEKKDVFRNIQAHLEASQRIAHIGSWELDLTDKVNVSENPLFWSAETYRIFGFEPGSVEVTNELFFSRVHPEDRPRIEKAIRATIERGVPYDIEHLLVFPDGSEKIVHECSEIIRDDLGRPLKMIGTVQDVTARRLAELQLRNSEYKFRSLIKNSSDVITVVDKDLNIIFVSDSAQRITGYSADEIVGMRSFAFAHPDHQERVERFMRDVVNNPGKPKVIEYKTLKKDGTYFWCERIAVNLVHDPGVEGIVSNFRDITDRKVYEEALKASNEELTKSNAELDKFVYSVSHDLRAPLASIQGIVELSMTETGDENMLQNLELIGSSVRKLDGFIKDILDYSRNARGQVKCELIHFEELLQEIKETLRFMNSGSSHVEIRTAVANGTDFYSDRSRLHIILNNLVSNSIRYSTEAGPYVDISIKLDPEQAVITVADNGIGIDENSQRKVFDMFYRVSKKSVGSGLGLYIVKETVEKLNGQIELQSVPGEGTTITIIIPNSTK